MKWILMRIFGIYPEIFLSKVNMFLATTWTKYLRKSIPFLQIGYYLQKIYLSYEETRVIER